MPTVTDLVGAGVMSLQSRTNKVTIDVLVFPQVYRVGRATPTNYYDIGLIRFGDNGRYYAPIPIDAVSMLAIPPLDSNVLGYSLFGSAVVRVTEEP